MFILLEAEFIRFILWLQHLHSPSGSAFALLHHCCLESVDAYLLKSGLIIYSWAGKNGTYKMFSKTSSKRIAKHLDESERVPFLLQLIAGFLCKLLVVSIPPVSLSVLLWSSSLPVGSAVGGMCVCAGLPLPWLLSGSAVVYGGLRVKRCFGAAVNLSCNQSQCNTSKRPQLLTKPTHSHLVIKGRLD